VATFTWVPSKEAVEASKPRKRAVSFGDGYEHRIGWGLNRDLKIWRLPFNNRTDADREAILTFLEARAGVEAFDWTPPRGTSGRYVCDDWEATLACARNTFTLTFRQVPA
jgi:phage-related protein